MSATASRIGFILNPFRRAVAENVEVKSLFGAQARQSEDPVETFFDEVEDADVMAAERQELLSQVRRRFDCTVSGVDEVMALDYSIQLPVAYYTDTERDAERKMLIGDITIDLGKQAAKLNIWG